MHIPRSDAQWIATGALAVIVALAIGLGVAMLITAA